MTSLLVKHLLDAFFVLTILLDDSLSLFVGMIIVILELPDLILLLGHPHFQLPSFGGVCLRTAIFDDHLLSGNFLLECLLPEAQHFMKLWLRFLLWRVDSFTNAYLTAGRACFLGTPSPVVLDHGGCCHSNDAVLGNLLRSVAIGLSLLGIVASLVFVARALC